MSDGSSIEWTEATWNPIRGCTKVSPGCKHCYAETFSERWRGIKGHPFEQGFDLRLVPEALDKPLRWKKPRKIFVNSMSDLFHEDVPNEYIAAVFGVMAACPQHTFQVLTKRAERLPEWFAWLKTEIKGYWHGEHGRLWEALRSVAPSVGNQATWEAMYQAVHGSEPATKIGDVGAGFRWPLLNVHLGVSVEDQPRADRILHLLKTPAAVRWISAEPLLGALDCTRVHTAGFPLDRYDVLRGTYRGGIETEHLDWVVVGAESGRHNRPMEQAWVRSLRDQCVAADVPFFFKQDATPTGRKIKLPVLDGRQWQEFPEAP